MGRSTATPFLIDPSLAKLGVSGPDSETFLKALSGSSRHAREVLARQWLSEGIPAAFSNCPSVYEELRGWLACRLNVHEKEISIAGSARLGYSLAKPPKYGRRFSDSSDLDLFVVSAALFINIEREFQAYADSYMAGEIAPRSERERGLWPENIRFGKINIPKGFFDANKIPMLDKFPISSSIGNSMWVLCEKLRVTEGAPRPSKASIRIYKDWASFVDRLTLNLHQLSA